MGRDLGLGTTLRVLVVEDSVNDAALTLRELERGGYDVYHERVETPEGMNTALEKADWDVVIADHAMPRFSAPAALEILQERDLDLPFIIVSGKIGEDAAVAAMRAGAHDYVGKDNLARLCPAVEREIREAVVRREHRRAEAALGQSEQLYRAVVEQSTECILLVDVKTKRVLEANPALQRLLDYTLEELKEKTLYDFVAHNPESVNHDTRRVLEDGHHFIGEQRYRRKDGALVDVEARANVISFDGREAMCVVSHEITERKKADETLRAGEEKFRSLVQNASDMIVVLDAGGTITYESPAVERVLGYRPEERIGTRAFDHLHPDDLEAVRSRFSELLEKPDERMSIEYRVRGKDGSWRYFEAIGANMLHEPGIGGIVINARDITERKRAEEELTRLASFPLLNPNPVFETSATGEPIYLNPAAERLVPDVHRLGNRHPMLANLETVVSELQRTGSRQYGREVRVGERYYQQAISPIPGSDLVRVYAFDVTERRLAEEKLRESEERYRVVTETASDTIVMIDEDSRIHFVNGAAEKVFGYSREEMLGQQLTMLMPEELREAHRVSLRRYLDTGERRLDWNSIELPGMHKSGREIPLEVSFGEFVKGGEHFFTGFIRDVTERKRAEEAHARLAAIVQSSDDAIIGKTLEGIITSWNSGAERLYGYFSEEVIGKPISILAPPNLLNEIPQILEKIRRGDAVANNETVRVAKDGRHLDISLTVSPIKDSAGNIVGASTIARDITELKRAEEKMREIKESERRRIAAELHDDVLQDLVYGLQEIQIMQMAVRGDQDDKSNLDSLQTISEALQRSVEGLREAIFELRWDETLEKSVVSSVESLVELNRRMSRGRYEVHLSIDGFSEKLSTDTGRGLVRIVQEALNNARRHSGARNVWVTLKMERGDVCAEVVDNGQGFDTGSTRGGIGTSTMRQRALERERWCGFAVPQTTSSRIDPKGLRSEVSNGRRHRWGVRLHEGW